MKAITLYVVLVFAFSSVFYALIIASGHVEGGNGRYGTGLDWCPAAAALLTCTLLRIDIGTIGWRWRPWRWQILAYATPLLLCLIGYVAVWATGLGGFPNGKTVDSLKAALGIPSLSTSQVIVLWTLLLLFTGADSMATALGEEIGWRGFLSPRLAERYGFTRAAFITGAVWATWHFPILFFADFNSSASPIWFSLPCFVIVVLGLSVITLWLRLRSGSVWTSALVHASYNLWNGFFFTSLTAPRGAITNYTIDDSGFVLPIVISITAYLFWRQRAAVLPAGNALAQAPDAGCALPSEPKDIPAALDAAISGPADKDRACMKALLIPEARMMFVSLGTDAVPTYKLETLDDWIARVKARGHALLEEKQLKFQIERYGNSAHLWSSYALHSDGKQVARGINSIQAIQEAGGWRVTSIMVQAESATAPLPKEYLP